MKNNNRSGILLSPELIAEGKPAFRILHIIKKNKSVDFINSELTKANIQHEFPNYPKPFRDLLMQCNGVYLEQISKDISFRYSHQKAGIAFDDFFEKNFVSFWHKLFEGLRPYYPLEKWYYRKEQPEKKNFLTSPCKFSAFKPGLSFEVVKSNGVLQLSIYIVVNDASYPLKTFTRYHFLLVSKNEFFILSHKDYQTLENIEKINFSKYRTPDEFAKHVLSDLEKDYPVKRNNHIAQVEITSQPICRVLLTELNNTFLMLTPQWLYDDFLIDGAFNESSEKMVNGICYSIKRNKEIEENFIKTIVSLHKNFPNQRNGFFYLTFADAIKGQWFFKVYQRFLKMDIELAGMDMLANFRYSPYSPETKMVLKSENEDALIFEMQLSFGKELISLHELQKMLLAGQKAVMLKDGALGVLDENWLNQYAYIVKHGKINKSEIEVLRWMAVTEQHKTDEKTVLKQSLREDWWEKWKRWQTNDTHLFPLSSGFRATLRPYQQKGYEWLLLLQEIGAGACLADDMGLGKTIQAISFIAHFMHQYQQSKNIIICPASLIYNWKQEFEKFAPSINTIVYHGSARQKEELSDTAPGVIITTYSTMRNDVETISQLSFGVAVLDESHNIKNPGAQISQAVMKIRARFRLALSGTPVINNTFDLYSQLHFVVPGLFGSREFFRREYANPIDNFQDEERTAALKKLTAPFILRRTKQQVAKDLPAKTETILWCRMNGRQRNVYEEILNSTRSNLFLEIKNKGLAKSKLSILQSMTKLRQVCCSPLLLSGDEKSDCMESVKTEVLMSELENVLSKHKAIVFSQFTSMLNLLQQECKKHDIDYYHFDGQTPPDKRAEMVTQFQREDNTVHLFLISLKAGNTGITLTAADYVFLFDPWWNTAVQDQAIDRTHRIGQTKNVFAYKMICKDTIEEKIVNLQQKKKKLSEDLVSADNGFVKSLTEEEVQYLFS
jgi:SNF2 family DNA or RNA helicase